MSSAGNGRLGRHLSVRSPGGESQIVTDGAIGSETGLAISGSCSGRQGIGSGCGGGFDPLKRLNVFDA